MKNIYIFLLLFSLLLASCAPLANPKSDPITILDALGREVLIESAPTRIVIAGRQTPMLTHFFYLFENAGDKILAIENRTQTTEEFIKQIDKGIGEKYLLERGATAEQIVPLNPDVVLIKSAMRETVGLQLEEIGVPVVYVDFESIDDIYRDINIIAGLLADQERGDWLINEYQKMVAEIENKIKSKDERVKPAVLLLQVENEDQTYVFKVPASDWLQTNLIERVGAFPVWKDQIQGGGWSEVNIEQIASWNPDYFFIVNYNGQAPHIIAEIQDDEIWSQLSAVKNDHIYPFIYDFISWDQPDPRWILAYAWLANRLYPDSHPAISVQQQIEYFFSSFYFIEDQQLLSDMKNRLNEFFR